MESFQISIVSDHLYSPFAEITENYLLLRYFRDNHFLNFLNKMTLSKQKEILLVGKKKVKRND